MRCWCPDGPALRRAQQREPPAVALRPGKVGGGGSGGRGGREGGGSRHTGVTAGGGRSACLSTSMEFVWRPYSLRQPGLVHP